MNRLRSAVASDSGISVPELMISTLIIGFVMAIVGSLMSGVLRDWGVQESLAAVQEESRPVVRDMLIQIRQSTSSLSALGNNPVSEMSWDTLVFYSDRIGDDNDAPEKHVYELVDCTNGTNGGQCSLQLSIYNPTNPTALENWDYGATPDRVDMLLENVIAEPPVNDSNPAWTETEVAESLFYMIRWEPGSSGNPERVVSAACDDLGSSPCDGNLVVISLAINPSNAREYLSTFELYEEVRLRNA